MCESYPVLLRGIVIEWDVYNLKGQHKTFPFSW